MSLGQLRAALLEPVAELTVADDVVPVVPLDPIEVIGFRTLALAELEPLLEGNDARSRVAEVNLAFESVERFHLLDRVALDGGAHGLTDGAEQVDQDAASEELVDLVLAGPVPAHQALEGGRLVRRVVIDVERRIGGEALHDEVDQPLERASFALQGELAMFVARPDRTEPARHVEDAEQVVEPVVERVRVALDVEEQVAR